MGCGISTTVICMSLCWVWHLCNLPCVDVLFRLISIARYVYKSPRICFGQNMKFTVNMLLTQYLWHMTSDLFASIKGGFLSQISSGVSIKFVVGSWLEENNRLYEQGAVRSLNLGGSGGMLPQKILKSGSSEIRFPAFWEPTYHASTSRNHSVCKAIWCEVNVKKLNILQLGERFHWQNLAGVYLY